MKKSGLADSPFFSMPQKKKTATSLSDKPPTTVKKQEEDLTEKPKEAKQSGNHDTMTPRNHDTIIELVRKAVKEYGKEAATYRFTTKEKKVIAGIIYSYKSRGIRTSENQITRIAVNFIINDYKENGENSVLDKALRALNG